MKMHRCHLGPDRNPCILHPVLPRWLLASAPTQEKAYSRMALLLTPGTFVPWNSDVTVELRAENDFLNAAARLHDGCPLWTETVRVVLNLVGERACERRADGGRHRRSICTGDLPTGRPSHAVAERPVRLCGDASPGPSPRGRFRPDYPRASAVRRCDNVLAALVSGVNSWELQSPEVKGNVNVNPALGMRMMVPHQCAKVRSGGYVDDLEYGLITVRTTTRPLRMPGALLCDMHRERFRWCPSDGA